MKAIINIEVAINKVGIITIPNELKNPSNSVLWFFVIIAISKGPGHSGDM